MKKKVVVALGHRALGTTLPEQMVAVHKSAKAIADLIEDGYDEAMGARPLRRVIEQQIRDQVTDFYLDNPGEKKLSADLVDGQVVISAIIQK